MLEPGLQQRIKDLCIAATDMEARSPTYVSFGAVNDDSGAKTMQEVLHGPKNPVYGILEKLSDSDLAQVMALALYGRNDGAFSTFNGQLQDARDHIRDHGRDRTVVYVGGKPLAKYLPAGIKRATAELG